MIYEVALVARPELDDKGIADLKKLVQDVVKSHEGELFVEDDWGKLTFAQASRKGNKGHYLYFMFTANNQNNKELVRRFRINEGVMRHMIIKLADDLAAKDELVKNYKSPYSKTKRGSVADANAEEVELEGEGGDNKRKFSRRKSCWFTANNLKADWKDPGTYAWLINEFGKISPARISAVSTKHQRFATSTIKQARQIGLASCVSNYLAH
jgi:ribosomal protein S6/ribosomal protein S18